MHLCAIALLASCFSLLSLVVAESKNDWHPFVTTDTETYSKYCGGENYRRIFRRLEERQAHYQLVGNEDKEVEFSAFVHLCNPDTTSVTEKNFSPFCGGLGDRIKGLLSTFYLSLLGDRAFYINHTFPRNINEYFVPVC